tara:strand:- start:315 stop:449 length:135 start_codon:yes stop_codon:yes gene_type:complete
MLGQISLAKPLEIHQKKQSLNGGIPEIFTRNRRDMLTEPEKVTG